MRTALRIFFLLLLAAGIVLAVVLPRMAERGPGYDVGKGDLYAAGVGSTPLTLDFAPSEALLFLDLEVTTEGPLRATPGARRITLSIEALGGKDRLAAEFELPDQGMVEAPQSGRLRYAARVILRDPLDGRHAFSMEPSATLSDPALRAVTLSVGASAIDLDPRLQPGGFVLFAIGVIGFLVTLRKNAGGSPPSGPKAPRWGRSAGADQA